MKVNIQSICHIENAMNKVQHKILWSSPKEEHFRIHHKLHMVTGLSNSWLIYECGHSDQHHMQNQYTCYDHPLLFLSLVLLCFPFCIITSRVFNPHYQHFFYFNIFGSNHSSLEYSPQNIPLYYLTFHCLLLLSIFFVISLTINIYKPHNSLPCFSMLVYLVFLAPINPLVISSRFRQVFALLPSRRFLLNL